MEKSAMRIFGWVSAFAIAFALIESAIVVYIRGIYYPEGFVFPLKPIAIHHLTTELIREFSTLVVILAVSVLAGKTGWQRFAYYIFTFGIWDIFYYVWLKVLLDWPASIFEFDVLFLIPLPWIAPVLAPVLISILLVVSGYLIVRKEERDGLFKPPRASWMLSILGSVVILYSFMHDLGATLRFRMPSEFAWHFFTAGMILLVAAVIKAFAPRKKRIS